MITTLEKLFIFEFYHIIWGYERLSLSQLTSNFVQIVTHPILIT